MAIAGLTERSSCIENMKVVGGGKEEMFEFYGSWCCMYSPGRSTFSYMENKY